VLQEHFDAGEALALIERERCTLFYGTPNMAQALHEHPDRVRRDLSSLRGGATIGTPEQIMRVVELGAREVCNIYGLTETYGNCNVADAADPLEKRLASVGQPLVGVDQRIVDPETGGASRRRGRRGPGERLRDLRLLQGPGAHRQSLDEHGYFRPAISASPTPTASLPRPHQGDGEDRRDQRRAGRVEEVLMSHPGVHAAFVTGVPDPQRDEVLAAVIVEAGRDAVGGGRLRLLPRTALAAYKVRAWSASSRAELPLTTTGKLQKNRLAATFFADRSGRLKGRAQPAKRGSNRARRARSP
jgi:fatty-acyl-CoA synthase